MGLQVNGEWEEEQGDWEEGGQQEKPVNKKRERKRTSEQWHWLEETKFTYVHIPKRNHDEFTCLADQSMKGMAFNVTWKKYI